jgi:hypothetical protein
MKLFVNHLSLENINNYLKEKKIDHIDFSLFVDDTPKSPQDLSSINILVLQEPNEYFGLHDWAINNQHLFSFILAWSDKVLNSCPNSIFLPFGNLWMDEELYSKKRNKKFEISHLCGKKLMTYGQSLRHEILARKNEIKIPINFFSEYGEMSSVKKAAEGKEFIYGNSMFGIVIENTSHRGYFTEKIMDCFSLKTLPLYWGCSNISNFFNEKGIIKFNNVDDLIYIVNNLNENYYYNHLEAIEDNYQKAINFIDYEIRITEKIKEIFVFNNII